jgi:transposase
VRQINFVDGEIAILERVIAEHALTSSDVRRLMTVPGVSLMTASTFMAAVGDIERFPGSAQARQLSRPRPQGPSVGQLTGTEVVS